MSDTSTPIVVGDLYRVYGLEGTFKADQIGPEGVTDRLGHTWPWGSVVRVEQPAEPTERYYSETAAAINRASHDYRLATERLQGAIEDLVDEGISTVAMRLAARRLFDLAGR